MSSSSPTNVGGDGMAFCIVCGRFDRELMVRKSGLKCIECVGRRHNKGFAQLQHQQATFMLSRTMMANNRHPSPMGAGAGSKGGGSSSLARPNSGGRKHSVDLSSTTGGIGPIGGSGGGVVPMLNLQIPTGGRGVGKSPRGPSATTGESLLFAATLGNTTNNPSFLLGSTTDTAPNVPPGEETMLGGTSATAGTATLALGTVNYAQVASLSPEDILSIDFDTLSVKVCDVKTEEIVRSGLLKHKETATLYTFVVYENRRKQRQGLLPGRGGNNNGVGDTAAVARDGGASSPTRELTSVRHRFSTVFTVLVALKGVGQHALPELPQKKVLGRFDEKFIEERRAAMEIFLNAALDDPFFARHPQLQGFLGVEPLLREQERLKKQRLRMSLPPANDSKDDDPNAEFLVPQQELDSCKLGSVIGKGSFGTVRLGLLPSSSQLVAVKVMRIASVHEGEMQALQGELDLLRTLSHPNIVTFLGISWKDIEKELLFFTEYVECGSIATMVNRFGALPLPVIQRYMKQILTGLLYLHDLGIVHRDIKGDNILVTKDGHVKLADFGCSTQLSQLNLDGAPQDEGITGTPLWMAPEAMRGETQGLLADIWSLGCLGIEMLKHQPWRIGEKENIFSAMYRIQKSTGLPDGLPSAEEMDPDYRTFLLRCLQRDADERPSAKELLQDPFFGVDFVKPLEQLDSPRAPPRSPRIPMLGELEQEKPPAGGALPPQTTTPPTHSQQPDPSLLDDERSTTEFDLI